MNVYLDHAATAPLSPSTKEYIISLLDTYGNPSSLHSLGQQAKDLISNARKSVARFINATPETIFFTSGGAASNTLALRGYTEKHNCSILYSPIAHKSILNYVKGRKNCFPLCVNKSGKIDLQDMKELLSISGPKLVVVDCANSEIGTIQDVKKIIETAHFYNATVYLDCTGSIPTIPLDVKMLDIDMCGFSGHKLGGLKGCGVLYKKKQIQLEPLIYGSQEQGLIGGTENVLGISTLGFVINHYNYSSISSASRDYVLKYIETNVPDVYMVGDKERLQHNLYLCFRGIEGESLMLLLDINGIHVSTGSACNSGDLSASPTLKAIQMDPDDIHSCIRMTFSGNETKEELDFVCQTLSTCIEKLRTLTTMS